MARASYVVLQYDQDSLCALQVYDNYERWLLHEGGFTGGTTVVIEFSEPENWGKSRVRKHWKEAKFLSAASLSWVTKLLAVAGTEQMNRAMYVSMRDDLSCVFTWVPVYWHDVLSQATSHAELVAIDEILRDGTYTWEIFRECRLYVTCEPCIMCASALALLQIGSVCFGCHNDRFGGNGSIMSMHEKVYGAISRHSYICTYVLTRIVMSSALPHDEHLGYPITHGIMKMEAVSLLKTFYDRGNPRRKSSYISILLIFITCMT